MKLNMGTLDRAIRVAIAAVIALLYLAGFITGTLAAILVTVAVILLVTSVIGWCPAYLPFGMSTRKKA